MSAAIRPAKFVIWQLRVCAFRMRELLPDCKSGRTGASKTCREWKAAGFFLHRQVCLFQKKSLIFVPSSNLMILTWNLKQT